ncbi:mannose-1-phosphate guanylyltransferase/phosphomannomutase [Bacillus ectoiniformans]|uniref:nucleotidyltransferase family protein n=1 Tax=Bacillus ectoiniformans TaxID=1494429 RepID=UPI001958EB3A|nr:nucleotidyltransferase family protein [Bacillus ectoiniformans]MBM7650044.1 mannose-1-phosphate guanylyltransferase/phosphomannomutase [Bacillus ectoiniformans]
MKGVILAGGRGRRLKPFTNFLPKPMIPLMDQPLLEYTLRLLKNEGIDDVTLTVCYKKEKIINHIGDGSQFDMNISYIEETNPLGTAGSLFYHSEEFQDTLVVISGDALTNISLRDAYHFHREKQALFTIVTVEVPDPEGLGICLTNHEGKLVSFLEKPAKNQIFSNKVNTGIYIINPELFRRYDFSGETDFAHDIFPALLKNNERVYVYHTHAYWQDIGTPLQYAIAQKRLKSGIAGINTIFKAPSIPFQNLSPGYLERFNFSHMYASGSANVKKS